MAAPSSVLKLSITFSVLFNCVALANYRLHVAMADGGNSLIAGLLGWLIYWLPGGLVSKVI